MPKSAEKFVIVNADDFGLTTGINRGIIEAHERGVVTSASLMVRGPAASEAADYARSHGDLDLGLHVDLAEWRFLRGEWKPHYQVVDIADALAVHDECQRQLAHFQELTGRLPTHFDSHQHVHLSPAVRPVLTKLADELDSPLRSCSPKVTYFGKFFGQTGEGAPNSEGISPTAFISIVTSLPPGWSEIGCHPGYADGLDSVYALEREVELRALCSLKTREGLERASVRLRSFRDLRDR